MAEAFLTDRRKSTNKSRYFSSSIEPIISPIEIGSQAGMWDDVWDRRSKIDSLDVFADAKSTYYVLESRWKVDYDGEVEREKR